MQAPLYHDRKALLAALAAAARDTATHWAVHGMRDIIPIISGMISQLALSFTVWEDKFSILWCDLRDSRKYVTSLGMVFDTADNGDDVRYEMPTEGYGAPPEHLCKTFISDGKLLFDTGHGTYSSVYIGGFVLLYASLQLEFRLLGSDKQYKIPQAASTARFVSIPVKFDGANVPTKMIWMDSDGCICKVPTPFIR